MLSVDEVHPDAVGNELPTGRPVGVDYGLGSG